MHYNRDRIVSIISHCGTLNQISKLVWQVIAKWLPTPGLDCTPVGSRSLQQHAGDGTFWLGSTPTLRKNILGGQRPTTSPPLPPTSREDLQLDGYLE
ncbi:hypothetical protein TNCV_2038311 [Trichonephila clavipes]|nr:hypothetical protein TNCV_2038311 [Trichonephila clavipes]